MACFFPNYGSYSTYSNCVNSYSLSTWGVAGPSTAVTAMLYRNWVEQDLEKAKARLKQLQDLSCKDRQDYNKLSISSPQSPMGCDSSTSPAKSVVQAARDLFLSEDEKALQDAGFKDSCGVWTLDARTIMLDLIMKRKKNKAKLVEIAKELNDEKKAKAKKCS